MKLVINRPCEDERLSWPCRLTYSGRFTHINNYPSAASPVQTSESSPVRDRRSPAEPPNQLTGRQATDVSDFLSCGGMLSEAEAWEVLY